MILMWFLSCNNNRMIVMMRVVFIVKFYDFKYKECYSHCTLLVCLFRSKVHALCYAPHAKKLVSCSEDGIVRIWDMNVKRQEVHNQQAGSLTVS